jgi:histidinol dehydrogenase
MQIYRYPLQSTWGQICKRPLMDYSAKVKIVREVMNNIKEKGDKALREYTFRFDHVDLKNPEVTPEELQNSGGQLSQSLKDAISIAAKNIEAFHTAQRTPLRSIETMPGVKCWQKAVAIEKVGFYIPGGSAPLFSTVLMLGIPARIAGSSEIVLCTPPDKEGKVHPAILYAAGLCHISKIFKAGGIQAIGAMANGTQSVPKVDKIFGPGNSWVMAAKQYVSLYDCAIDMPAGPSEVAVMADSSANVEFIAADLLSQAEHGPDSQVILITTEEDLIKSVIKAIERQIKQLPRSETAFKALENSRAILSKDEDEMVELINLYAPEHLIIATKTAHDLAERIINAGSVFIGNYSPESAGDYASGTNHTLPTNGWARSYNGVNLDSFCKKITFQEITSDGIQKLGPIIEELAEAEQLFAHKNAASLRLKALEK